MSTLELRDVPVPWNKGKLIGQRPPLKLQEVWSIRIRLQISKDRRALALFNLAIDSKLRSCDLVQLKISDVSQMGVISSRAMVLQQKTKQPVQFEIMQGTRDSLYQYLTTLDYEPQDYLFRSRLHESSHLSHGNMLV